jgi:uncharacterized protein
MRYCLLVVIVVIFALPPVFAQLAPPNDAPASKQEVESLLAATHVRERMQLIMENSRKQSKSMLEEILHKELPEANHEELAQAQGMADEMIDDVQRDYPIDAVMQDLVPVYQKHLSSSDCEGLVAFYSSPLGQKVLRELPAITMESMQVSNAHLQPRLEAAISKLKEKIGRMAEEDRNKKNITDTKPATK